MAKTEQQKLKEKLDKIFSIFIRLRDSDSKGIVRCITCGKGAYWEKDGIHNGHYISRKYLITRFDENNCNGQCETCNIWRDKGEMQMTYREELCDKIGDKKVLELEKIRHKIFKVDIIWYQDKIKLYTEKVKKLLKKRGIM